MCLFVWVRSKARPEEGVVLLLQEKWQAGSESGPVGWLSGRDVGLPSRRGEIAQTSFSVSKTTCCQSYYSYVALWCAVAPPTIRCCSYFDNIGDLVSSSSVMFRSLWWWPLLVWPRTLWVATTWTCCYHRVSLEPGCTVAKTPPALDTSSPCSGQQPPYKLQLLVSCVDSPVNDYQTKALDFLSFQPTGSPCFSTCGRQPAQVQLWRQSARGARVVHSHHPHSVDQRCWRYRHWLGQQDPQLQHTRDHQQHLSHARRRRASAHGEGRIRPLSDISHLVFY